MRYPTTRRTKMHALLINRHEDLVKRLDAGLLTPPARNLYVRRGYALNCTLEDKTIDASKHHEYTAFVNVKGNLVHVVPRDGRHHVRIPLYQATAGCTDAWVKTLILAKM